MEAYLILADGSIYTGEHIGASGEVIGEAVFTTAMVGYMETLTDPSYYGQIIIHTFPLIGNYGAIPSDTESEIPALSGYVVRELCECGSNFRKESELNAFLIRNNIVGISGLDTRELTRKIRESGVMNAMITDNKKGLDEKIKKLRAFKIRDAVKHTSTKEPLVLNDAGKRRVVLWDFGAKRNIERELIQRGCQVIRMPQHATAQEILALEPDGIMLSNGGGDPAENTEVIAQLTELNRSKIPTFGICLGHQLMALSIGGKTKKLKYGHRGGNQPVKDIDSGRVFITSQNHGYAVIGKSLPEGMARVNMISANDATCEGVEYLDQPAFSVQFHPEASGGPRDTEFLFDRFIRMMEGGKNA